MVLNYSRHFPVLGMKSFSIVTDGYYYVSENLALSKGFVFAMCTISNQTLVNLMLRQLDVYLLGIRTLKTDIVAKNSSLKRYFIG